MDITNWCILASVLLVSANAGPQNFFEFSSSAPQVMPNYETKDFILYLTPKQVQALEVGGAVLRPQEDNSERLYPPETELEVQEEEEESKQNNEKIEEENLGEENQIPKEVSELEEIFRILNKQIEEDAKRIHGDSYSEQLSQTENGQGLGEENEEEEQQEKIPIEERDEVHQEEKQLGNFRKIPSRFGVLQRYRVEKYFAPSISKTQNQQQKDNYIQYLPDHRKSNRFQEENKKSEIERVGITENKNNLQEKYKLIPVEGEYQEGNTQKLDVNLGQEQLVELISPVLENNKIVQSIAHSRGQLVESKLKLYKGLQEPKAAPKNSNRQYATEIDRLRANLEAQNALDTAEALAKRTRFSPKDACNKKSFQLDNDNRESLPLGLRSFVLRSPQPFAPLEISTPIPVPVIKRSRIEIKSPVPIKLVRRAPATASNKGFLDVEHSYEKQVVPVKIDKEIPLRSKPEEIRIIRHLWEH